MVDDAKYYRRFIEKAPTMNMRKDEMIVFMSKHEIEIPNPIPTKLVLLEKMWKKKYWKTVSHWLYDWKSWLFFSTVAHIIAYWVP